MDEKTINIDCAACATRDRILNAIMDAKQFDDVSDACQYRFGFTKGFEEGVAFALECRKYATEMPCMSMDVAPSGTQSKTTGFVVTAVQNNGKDNAKTVIEPCGESISAAEVMEKYKELDSMAALYPEVKEGEIGVIGKDGWVNAQKATEFTVGDYVILAENLNLDDGGGGIAVSDEHPEYGRYYTWEAAVRIAKKIKGWHLPTVSEAVEMNRQAHKDPTPVIFAETGYLLDGPGHNRHRPSGLIFWTATDSSNLYKDTPVMAWSVCVDDGSSHLSAKSCLFSVRLFKNKE